MKNQSDLLLLLILFIMIKSKNDILTIPNFLEDEDLGKVRSETNNKLWSIQVSNRPEENKGLEIHDFLILDVSNRSFFNEYLFNKVQQSLSISCELERVYFNLQWPGRDGRLHKDGCDFTALLYISNWNLEWGGFTQIVTPSNEIRVFPPIPNMLLCFPGDFLHKGFSFTSNSPKRLSLAFKLANVRI